MGGETDREGEGASEVCGGESERELESNCGSVVYKERERLGVSSLERDWG